MNKWQRRKSWCTVSGLLRWLGTDWCWQICCDTLARSLQRRLVRFSMGCQWQAVKCPSDLIDKVMNGDHLGNAGALLRADIWTEFDRITIGFPPLQTAPDCAGWTLRYRLWREIDRSVLLLQGRGEKKQKNKNKDDNQMKRDTGWVAGTFQDMNVHMNAQTHTHTHKLKTAFVSSSALPLWDLEA